MVYFIVRVCDVWEGNVTTRREIYTEHICSLGFRDIREGAALQRVMLGRLGCGLQSVLMDD